MRRRILFGTGALLGVYAFSPRRGLRETKAFRNTNSEPFTRERSLLRGIWQDRAAVLRVIENLVCIAALPFWGADWGANLASSPSTPVWPCCAAR